MVRRGIDLVGQRCSASPNSGQDLVGGVLPCERAWVIVPVVDQDLDRVDELINTVERAAA